MHKGFLILVTILSIFLSAETSGASEKALLVGVGKYTDGTVNELKGPPNDLDYMQYALINFYDFKKEDIRVLLDDQATKSNIIGNFKEWLVDKTKPGDMVLFYFSGHGSFIPDGLNCQTCIDNDESDSYDEVLLPHDFSSNLPVAERLDHLIVDDELGQMLQELKGREVIIILDSCHSGTATRSIGNNVVSILENTPAVRSKFQPIEWPEYLMNEPAGRKQSRQIDWSFVEEVPEGQVYLTASADSQTAVEATLQPELTIGLFTNSLFYAMEAKPDSSYIELYTTAKKHLKDVLRARQDPQIQPIGSQIVNKIAFRKSNLPLEQDSNPQETFLIKPQFEDKLLLKVEAISGASNDENMKLRNYLGKIPYVKIVESEYFDRLVRGEYSNGVYKLKLLNAVGDQIKFDSNNVEQTVKEMSPSLEYAYIVKKLASISNPGSDLRVNLDVANGRRDFRVGEKIVYSLKCSKDCYVIMINADSQGNVNLMFPNKHNQNNFLTGGKQLEIPSTEMRKKDFEFEVFPPVGEETVKVIATNKKIDLDTFDLGSFEALFQTAKGSPLEDKSPSRDFAEELKEKVYQFRGTQGMTWGEDTVVLRSHN